MPDAKITHLVTHSGSFHADEVCAYAVLRCLFPCLELVRTRDAARIDALEPHAIIFDVGDVYDHGRRRYDHHQKDRLMRPGTEVPYSSFGLIWRHYGHAYLVHALGMSHEEAQIVGGFMYGNLVFDIDAVDNGCLQPGQEALLHPLSLPALIMDQRPAFDDDRPDAEETAFLAATRLAETLIQAKAESLASKIRAQLTVGRAIEARTDPRWIELPRGMPYDEAIRAAGADDVLFVVNPARGEWQINIVAEVPGQFGARKDLPADWAGLRGADLEAVTGVEGSVFCHTARFIAVAETREAAMRLLEIALDTPA